MVSQKYRWDFIGLSTDTKPTSETSEKVVNGSTYYCSDTSKLYVYCDGTWYERKPLGGGGGTSDFNDLSNRPKYNGSDMTGSTNIPEVKTYTAGSNVNISDQNVISATDTTYSAFTGTDGTAAGAAGLVPAPATTDAGKFLKADGTWDTAGGGSGPTVVQTTGTSTTDVMSQNATTSMVFADPSTKYQVQIGNNAVTSGTGATSIGGAVIGTGNYSVAIGNSTRTTGANSVALGSGADASQKGQFDISTSFGGSTLGYNDTQYRLLTGLYDGQSAHDAATYGQVISYSAINGAGAPTTATEGKYVGQLYYDTTNETMYFLKTIDTTTAPATYTWEALGGGGGGPTVVQTPGDSTTDVMSQNAVTSMIFADPATQNNIKIGRGTSSSIGSDAIEIGHDAAATAGGSVAMGHSATASGMYGPTALGNTAQATGARSTAIGNNSTASANASIALGLGATATQQGQFDVSTGNQTTVGYNNSNYRLLTGLYDPQSAHDAATKGYVDPTTDSSAPTTATVGRLGQIQIDTTNADAYMCVAVDDVTPSYTWKKINA